MKRQPVKRKFTDEELYTITLKHFRDNRSKHVLTKIYLKENTSGQEILAGTVDTKSVRAVSEACDIACLLMECMLTGELERKDLPPLVLPPKLA